MGGIILKCIDFIYDGVLLSDFNCIICQFGGSSGTNIVPGMSITFNNVSPIASEIQMMSTARHENILTTTIQICKNICNSNTKFNIDEIRDITRWLMQRKYREYRPIDDEFDNITFMATCTSINYVKYGTDIIGLEITLETNSPYGFTEKYTYEIDSILQPLGTEIHNLNDDFSNCSPTKIEILVREAGSLTLSNLTENRNTVIHNCKKNEVITLLPDFIMTSTDKNHNLYDDFNYNYPRLIYDKDKGSTLNIIKTSLNAKITMYFKYIRKVGIL